MSTQKNLRDLSARLRERGIDLTVKSKNRHIKAEAVLDGVSVPVTIPVSPSDTDWLYVKVGEVFRALRRAGAALAIGAAVLLAPHGEASAGVIHEAGKVDAKRAVKPLGWQPGRTLPRDQWVITVDHRGYTRVEWSPGWRIEGEPPLDMLIGCNALRQRREAVWWRPLPGIKRPGAVIDVATKPIPPKGWNPRRTLPRSGRVIVATAGDMTLVTLYGRTETLVGCGALVKRSDILWWRPVPRLPMALPTGQRYSNACGRRECAPQ